MNIKTKTNIFYINRSEIEGRFEPIYYLPSIRRKLELMVNNAGITNLGNISEPIKNGSTPNGGQFQDNGINFYRSQDFNLYQIEKKQFITSEFNNTISRSFVQLDDILLAVVGATLGKVGIIKQKENEGNINQNVARIRIKDNNFLAEFIAIYLDSTIGQMFIKRLATITTQAYLNNELLSKLPIPKLNINLQQCIIDKYYQAYQLKQEKEKEAKRLLGSIDGYLLGELGITLPEIDNSLENRVFISSFSEVTGDRLDSKFVKSKILEDALLNSKWETSKLKDLILSIKTGTTPNAKYDSFSNEGIYFLRNSNLQNSELDLSDIKFVKAEFSNQLTYSFQNELIICIAGTVGDAAINNIKEPIAINQNITSIQVNENKINVKFLCSYFNTWFSKELVKRVCSVATIYYLNNKNLLNLFIPVPPIEKQNEIAEHISEIREEAKRLQLEAREILEKAKLEVEQMILGK